MSAAVSVVNIEELLNAVKSSHYFVVHRTPNDVKYYVVEYGTWLLVLPSDSIKVVDVKIRPLEVQPPADIMQHPRVRWLAEIVGKPPALKLFQYTFTPLRTRAEGRHPAEGSEGGVLMLQQVRKNSTSQVQSRLCTILASSAIRSKPSRVTTACTSLM